MEDRTSAKLLQEEAALFLATVRDTFKTSQKTVDYVVKSVNNLLDMFLNVLEESFMQNCGDFDGYIKMNQIDRVMRMFRGQSLFCGVDTCYKVETFIRNKSTGERVILQKVILSTSEVVDRNGCPKVVPQDFGYIVPFFPQLEQLLNCVDVLECVDNPLVHSEGVYRCITDGLYYRYHPVVLEHGNGTLVFEMHVDDVETCDACKSKTKIHNQRLFYWGLGNIHPEKRSTLKTVNLLAIVKSRVAKKYGNEPFPRHFVDALKVLGTTGKELNVRGILRRFFGILGSADADNPASCNLGGYKETHTAKRPCRMCMILSPELCNKFRQSFALLRNKEEHEKQLQMVLSQRKITQVVAPEYVDIYEGEDEEDVVRLEEHILEKYADHENPSINFGINGKSVLADAPGFDVTKCFPQDVMHLLAEGICELVLRLVLRDVCCPPDIIDPKTGKKRRQKPLLHINDLNHALQVVCCYGQLHKNKPTIIERDHILGQKLKQSAAQMLTLVRVMPFILLNRCTKDHQDLLIKLQHLVNSSMAFQYTEDDVDALEETVEDFGSQVKKMYPNVRSLKLHCAVHLGMQTRFLGPPRYQSCYKFELMHAEFTSLVTVVRTKKDVSLSTAKRQLCKRSAEIMKGKDDGTFLYAGDQVLNAVDISVSGEPACVSNLTEKSTVTKVGKLVRFGQEWLEGGSILVKDSEGEKLFGRISSIYLVEGEIVFLYQEYVTEHQQDVNAFCIKRCLQEMKCIKLDELAYAFPVVRFSFSLQSGVKAYLLLINSGI